MTSVDVAALMQSGADALASGEWEVSIAFYERALHQPPRTLDAADVAEILRRIGMVHRDRRDLEIALELFEASHQIATLNQLDLAVGRALVSWATVDQIRGDLDAAADRYEAARQLGERIEDSHLSALAEQNLGTLALVRGDLPSAMARFRSVLEYHEKREDHDQASRVLNNMAMGYVDAGEWEEAERLYDRATEAASRAEHRVMLGLIDVNRAELHIKRGDLAAARVACEHALVMHRELGSDYGCGLASKMFGIVCREAGDLNAAHRHFVEAARLARRCEDRLLEAQALREWARVYLAERRNGEALRRLNEAYRIFQGLSARRDLLELDQNLDELEESYLQVVRAWGESVESKDNYTHGHCERVGEYACMLAEAVGMTGRDLTWFRMGGYLHDVGKISLAPELLNKRGALSPEEWDQMKRHTIEGDALVAEIDFPWEMRPVVRSHHERWDGGGYPDGLHGDQIPRTARILCIADVYDALTTTRSYRRALTREEALQVMRADSGKLFDPELFPVFERLILERARCSGGARTAAA